MNNGDVTAVLDRVVKEQGGVDVWINCVGQNKAIGKTWEIPVDDIWNEVEVDLKSCIAGTHTALQYMIKADKGIIINFCGGGTDKPHLYASGYSAAKTAVARFNESVHLELAKDGSRVKIFGIQPGLVLNERTKLLCTDENSKKYMPEIETAFKEGRHADPLRTAFFVEFALQGVMDNLSGKVIIPGKLEAMAERALKNENPENGFVRVKHS